METDEVDDIMKACAGQEDEEGFIKYESKYWIFNLIYLFTFKSKRL